MKNIILFFLFFKSLTLFGQNDSIEKRIFNLGEEKFALIKSANFNIDSIKVQISIYENRIETESYFKKSKLSTIYFKTGKSFTKIVTRENSLMPEDFWRTNIFDFENGKIYSAEERFYSSARIHGIAGRLDKEVRESYSKTLNSEFLKIYVVELFDKIKNYQ